MIVIECTRCGKEIRADNQHAGRTARCPGCQTPVRLPSPEEPSAAPAQVARESRRSVRRGARRSSRPSRDRSSAGILWEVKRLQVMQSGLFGLVMNALLAAVTFTFGLLALIITGGAGSSVVMGVMYLMMVSVMITLMGGVQGVMGAALYNLVAHLAGGYRIQLQHSR